MVSEFKFKRYLGLSVFSLIAICFNAICQGQSFAKDELIDKGLAIYNENPDKALKYWVEAANFHESNENWKACVRALELQTYPIQDKYEFGQWKEILIKIDSIGKKASIEDPEIGEEIKSSNLRKWGVYYYDIELYQQALVYFEQFALINEAKEPDSLVCLGLYSAHQYIAAIYHKIGAHQSAVQEALNCITYLKCYRPNIQLADYRHPYLQVAQFYLATKDYSNARKYYQAGLQSLKAYIKWEESSYGAIVRSFNIVANFYSKVNQPDSVIYILNQAAPFENEKDFATIESYILLADAFLALNKKVKALFYLTKAKAKYEEFIGNKGILLATINHKIGKYFLDEGQPKRAIKSFDSSLENLLLDKDLNHMGLEPIVSDYLSGKLELASILQSRASVLLEEPNENTNSEISLLREVKKDILFAIYLIEDSKASVLYESERQSIVEKGYPTYEIGLFLADRLYQEKEKGAIGLALNLSDQCKSLALLGVYADFPTQSKHFLELLEQEQTYKAQIAAIDQEIFELKSKEGSPSKIETLEEDQKVIKYRFLQWRRNLQKTEPEYFELKLKKEAISKAKIRQEILTPNQALIEYFWGEDHLYIIGLSKDKEGIWSIPIQPIEQLLLQYQMLIQDTKSRENVKPQESLQHVLSELYSLLLSNPMKNLGDDIDKLLIIRDGELGTLPFELLIPQSNDKGRLRSKDFLVNELIISYAHSVSLILRQKKIQQDLPNKVFAGFAPSYQVQDFSNEDTLLNNPIAEIVRAGYFPLEGAERELKAIRKLVKGRTFTGGRATEENFKQQAKEYRVLHLAMHAITNDLHPQYSEFIFFSGPRK